MCLMQVDLFVNYDCDLQAANLFERTVRGISKIIKRTESAPMFGPAPPGPSRAKVLALQALLALLHSLDAWAAPMKVCACVT